MLTVHSVQDLKGGKASAKTNAPTLTPSVAGAGDVVFAPSVAGAGNVVFAPSVAGAGNVALEAEA